MSERSFVARVVSVREDPPFTMVVAEMGRYRVEFPLSHPDEQPLVGQDVTVQLEYTEHARPAEDKLRRMR